MSIHHRHNNSLRRAILAQAGPEAFPYQKASPMLYDAQYSAYSGYGGMYGHDTDYKHQHDTSLPGSPEIPGLPPVGTGKVKRVGRRPRRFRAHETNWANLQCHHW